MKTLKLKMSLDERDALFDLMQHAGWKPLVTAIEQLVADQEQSVLKYNIDSGVDKLVHAKLRAEGARKLKCDVEQLKEHFKKVNN